MIRILIADDHPVVRQGLKRIIEESPGMTVTGEASTGQEVLQDLRQLDCDVVLLDISMPGISGLDVLKQIRLEKRDLPVLVLSIHSEEEYAVRALRAGASGYLTKTSAPEELIKAIRRVNGGKKYVTSTLAEKLAEHLDVDAERPPHETLADREYQVFCMIARGKAGKEIAAELCLSPKTVSTYRTRILEKMKMKANAEIIRYAMKQGLVE